MKNKGRKNMTYPYIGTEFKSLTGQELTVQQFSELAGISHQAASKRLQKSGYKYFDDTQEHSSTREKRQASLSYARPKPVDIGSAENLFTLKRNTLAVIQKIRYQFPRDPDGKFMFAIVELAIRDLFVRSESRSAYHYLSGPIPHAEACGVDADWIRLMLKKAGVPIEAERRAAA